MRKKTLFPKRIYNDLIDQNNLNNNNLIKMMIIDIIT